MYLLPLDQRLTWSSGVVEAAKRAVYDGFCAAVSDRDVGALGIVADEASALPILQDAAARGFLAVSRLHSEEDRCPTGWGKVVVHYNVDSEPTRNAAEAARARQMAALLRQRHPSARVVCDLVLLPTRWQIAAGIRYYDEHIRPGATLTAVCALLAAGLEPDVWVIEGFDTPAPYTTVMAAVRSARRQAGCLVRAAGYEDATTVRLMAAARAVDGVTGVVLPRAPFWEPVEQWMGGRASRREAVASVTARVRQWLHAIDVPTNHLPRIAS
jgi:hypothetical protein